MSFLSVQKTIYSFFLFLSRRRRRRRPPLPLAEKQRHTVAGYELINEASRRAGKIKASYTFAHESVPAH